MAFIEREIPSSHNLVYALIMKEVAHLIQGKREIKNIPGIWITCNDD